MNPTMLFAARIGDAFTCIQGNGLSSKFPSKKRIILFVTSILHNFILYLAIFGQPMCWRGDVIGAEFCTKENRILDHSARTLPDISANSISQEIQDYQSAGIS